MASSMFHPANRRGDSLKDRRNMFLLCTLYCLQGVPTTLVLGSVPFLLKEKLSYTQIATFSLSGYPYALKLLWSPMIDALFLPSIGRRKSWILPLQFFVGTVMLVISFNVEKFLEEPETHINQLTLLFTALVVLVATLDVALDGWALTLLSDEYKVYTSACQTVGSNIGYFTSFSLFLILNGQSFPAQNGMARLTLGGYMFFWSITWYIAMIWLACIHIEDSEPQHKTPRSIAGVYRQLWSVCKLGNVQTLIVIHLLAKVGFAVNENITTLKMVDQGLPQGDLAMAILISFPMQLLASWVAAEWSQRGPALRPWIWAFWPRLGLSLVSLAMLSLFPSQPSTVFFVILVAYNAVASFISTVQLVGISRFHTLVSDPLIGATYMTLFNTFSTLGGTWPKWFIFKGIDYFSIAICGLPSESTLSVEMTNCATAHEREACKAANGVCIYERDGYYTLSGLCTAFGAIFLVVYVIPSVRKLQTLPASAWQVPDTTLTGETKKDRLSLVQFDPISLP